jgi:peptide deformylase
MWELEQQVEELVNKYIEESGAVCVSASQVGLDIRCGMVYVSPEDKNNNQEEGALS